MTKVQVHALLIDDAVPRGRVLDVKLSRAIEQVWERMSIDGLWPVEWPSPSEIGVTLTLVSAADIATLCGDDRPAAIDRAAQLAEGQSIVLLDLVLGGPSETDTAKAFGALDEHVAIPASDVASLSGFKVLQAFRGILPVVLITAARNPGIHMHALMKGAAAVIPKLTTDDRVYEAGLDEPEKVPLVAAFAAGVSRAVLLTLCGVGLQHAVSHAPRNVCAWSVLDRKHLEPRSVKGTQLLLLDVRGFSKLVHKCAENNQPRLVFTLMSEIWEIVTEVLTRHGFDVNNYIGDAVLAVAGVYNTEPTPTAALECTLELRAAFAMNGSIRKKLLATLQREASDLLHAGVKAALTELIESTNFGARIVFTSPDRSEAFYGYVGSSRRRQHTVLSRFMNALARAEAAAGTWEKETGELHKVREPAACYALWREDLYAELATSAEKFGSVCEAPKAYLGKDNLDIRDVPAGMNIWRIVEQAAAIQPQPPLSQPHAVSATI